VTRTLTRLCLVSLCCAFGSVSMEALADDASCIAASEQALTLRKQGKLHETLKQLALCADAACPGEVKSDCTTRIADVNAAMPTLILAAKDGSGNDLYDVTVTMDGTPVATKLDGRPLVLDPGEHAFHLQTAGQAPVDKTLVLREGDKDRRETIVIGPPPPVPAPAPTPAPAPGEEPRPAGSWWTTQRTLAVVGGGLGIVGLGMGSVFGVFALSSQSSEKTDCASPTSCTNHKQATQDYSTAGTDATLSTVSFIAGGVFLAAGAVLWFTQPSETGASPATGRLYLAPSTTGRGAGLVLGGEL
jgi:hypothetical protein